MGPIQEKIQGAIKDVAVEGGYQYIFDAQSDSILYADETTDVTRLVMEKLGIDTAILDELKEAAETPAVETGN